jgi:hypothetical protein
VGGYGGFARATYNTTAEYVSAVDSFAKLSPTIAGTGQDIPLIGLCSTRSYNCTTQFGGLESIICPAFLVGSTFTVYGTFADNPVSGTGLPCSAFVQGINMWAPNLNTAPTGNTGTAWTYYNSFSTCNTNLCNSPALSSHPSASHVIEPAAMLVVAAAVLASLL